MTIIIFQVTQEKKKKLGMTLTENNKQVRNSVHLNLTHSWINYEEVKDNKFYNNRFFICTQLLLIYVSEKRDVTRDSDPSKGQQGKN